MHFNFRLDKEKGFTLIETIVGIVVLAISLSVITTLIYPVAERNAEQLHQIKAAELGQSMLNEIQSKAFDENSDMAGGLIRCGELGVTCSTSMGADTDPISSIVETRITYNDVDDYNGLTYTSGNIKNSQGLDIDLYIGYEMNIVVCNDSDYDGDCTTNSNTSTAKLITVTITTPAGFDISFSTYRVNF